MNWSLRGCVALAVVCCATMMVSARPGTFAAPPRNTPSRRIRGRAQIEEGHPNIVGVVKRPNREAAVLETYDKLVIIHATPLSNPPPPVPDGERRRLGILPSAPSPDG